jgi:hypothetical protein
MRFLKGERGFQMAFLTRMIFSCLIDADRTAAAAFDAHGVGIPEIEHPSITALETALHEAMGRRVVEPNQINTLRDEVLRAAVARAAEPQGVFTLTVPTGGGKTLRRRQDRGALGRYTVGVPRTVRSEMIAKRIAEVIRSEEFGDQFVVLHNLDLYTSETGLDWDDITFRGTDTMIIG